MESEDVLHRVREQSRKLIGGTIKREFVRNGVKWGSIVYQFASRHPVSGAGARGAVKRTLLYFEHNAARMLC